MMTRDQRRSLALNCALADRLEDDPALVGIAFDNLVRLRSVHPRGPVVDSFDQWQRLLEGPLSELVAVLRSESVEAQQLRQNSPFAGVLSQKERRQVLEEFRHDDRG
jgi:hypothetical protein